jgi:hypothetical protein
MSDESAECAETISFAAGEGMFKAILNSVIIVPVLLGILAAKRGRRRQAIMKLLALVFIYDVFYILLLYYLRFRWVG